ncbi:MAG: hypothetical protein EKK41_19535 [Hyphomicrobiales bacterium]|nr:MAG: hypothetical protein EKK41_19535 [Hyphomicrobiales bacterium]
MSAGSLKLVERDAPKQARPRRRRVRQSDVVGLVKAARDAGFVVARIEVDLNAGKITLGSERAGESVRNAPFDEWLSKQCKSG